MSRFAFDIATPADDAALRELLAATPMDGRISIAFLREPSYFAAAAVEGRAVQVGVARDRESGRIVGMGSRSISERFVNEERLSVGYLSGLRLLPELRGQAALLARGYRFLRRLHEDRNATYYVTTIAADNEVARNILTSGRAGLPIYHPCGDYCTLTMLASRLVANGTPHRETTQIRPANESDRIAILKFLNNNGPARNFFPSYESGDLFTTGGRLRGLAPDRILLAFQGNEIVGTLGCWDQRAFKQIVVHGYRAWLRAARPLHNFWAKLRNRPTLPAAGSTLNTSIAAIPVIRHNDRDVFRQLLTTLLCRMAAQGLPMLLLGLHESDPLLPVARQFSGREYRTKLYIVYWPDERPDLDLLSRRVPYLELGAL
jgi:hypothetical protein